MHPQQLFNAAFIAKLGQVQLLIRRTYGPNAFANFAGWEKRKATKMKRDPWYRGLK